MQVGASCPLQLFCPGRVYLTLSGICCNYPYYLSHSFSKLVVIPSVINFCYKQLGYFLGVRSHTGMALITVLKQEILFFVKGISPLKSFNHPYYLSHSFSKLVVIPSVINFCYKQLGYFLGVRSDTGMALITVLNQEILFFVKGISPLKSFNHPYYLSHSFSKLVVIPSVINFCYKQLGYFLGVRSDTGMALITVLNQEILFFVKGISPLKSFNHPYYLSHSFSKLVIIQQGRSWCLTYANDDLTQGNVFPTIPCYKRVNNQNYFNSLPINLWMKNYTSLKILGEVFQQRSRKQ